MVINLTTGKEIAFTLELLDKRTVVYACNSDEGTKLYMKIDKEPSRKKFLDTIFNNTLFRALSIMTGVSYSEILKYGIVEMREFLVKCSEDEQVVEAINFIESVNDVVADNVGYNRTPRVYMNLASFTETQAVAILYSIMNENNSRENMNWLFGDVEIGFNTTNPDHGNIVDVALGYITKDISFDLEVDGMAVDYDDFMKCLVRKTIGNLEKEMEVIVGSEEIQAEETAETEADSEFHDELEVDEEYKEYTKDSADIEEDRKINEMIDEIIRDYDIQNEEDKTVDELLDEMVKDCKTVTDEETTLEAAKTSEAERTEKTTIEVPFDIYLDMQTNNIVIKGEALDKILSVISLMNKRLFNE